MDLDYSSRVSDDSRVEGDHQMSVRVHPFVGKKFMLEGRKFRLSDTFGEIRAAILDQVSRDRDRYDELYEFNDPKTDVLKMLGHYFPVDDSWTIASQFDGNSTLRMPTSINICLSPVAYENLGTRLPRPQTRPPDLPDSDHDYHDSFTRRPRTETLPFCAATTTCPPPDFYEGPLELKSSTGISISLDELEYCGSLSTSATHVLLTPNKRIWGILSTLNQDYKYLIIHIGWDRLSFVFLRIIRSFYPDMPFVAVTDLTPHHLDLLNFLDTPQLHVKYLYGWDVLEEADDLGVYHIERVDIKWLYVRPSDLECFPPNISERVSLPLPRDFDNVLSMIEWNPHFRRNQEWVRELDLFKANRKCVMFKPLVPLINLLSKRLREMEDCV